MKAIFHIHSRFSNDSFLSPKKIVRKSIKNNIDIICITDHNTIAGSVAAKQYAEKRYPGKLKVVIGAEYLTEKGDIIALNIGKEYFEKNPTMLINEVKRDGGIILLPHPFCYHEDVEDLAKMSDAIEIFNGRCSKEGNEKALNLAKEGNKPGYGGCDAHLASELKNCVITSINDTEDLLEFIKNSALYCQKTTDTWKIIYSQAIQAYKRKKISKCLKLLLLVVAVFGKSKMKLLFKKKNNETNS